MTDRSESASGAGRHRWAVTVVAVVVLAAAGGLVALVGAHRADPLPPPEDRAAVGVVPAVMLDWEPFSPRYADLPAEIPYRPRWTSDEFLCALRPADCERVWQHGGDGGECPGASFELELGAEADGSAARIVTTCAEWRASLDAGVYAVSNLQIDAESRAIRLSGLLLCLPHMRASPNSGFIDVDLARLAGEILPPAVDETRTAGLEGQSWTIQRNEIRRTDASWSSSVEPIALGDLDGDGWEDMLLFATESAVGGSLRHYENAMFTRRADGRLVSITGRIPTHPCTEQEMEGRRAQWRANFGLPGHRDIELAGRCECTGGEPVDGRVTHSIRVRLSLDEGFLTGTLQCERDPRDIPISGALWTGSTGVIHEFGIDGSRTADTEFTWSVTDGVVTIGGLRFGIGAMESAEWTVSGAVPGPAAEREGRSREGGADRHAPAPVPGNQFLN
jgi:hypothetical protein